MNQDSASSALKDWRRWPWTLWGRQALAVMGLELKKSLRGRRHWSVLLLAAAPVSLFALRAAVELPGEAVQALGGLAVVYAVVFRTFMLRLVVFFGCVAVFANLFRGELQEKTLHYYFLAPIRREVLGIGKYLAGLVSAGFILGSATAASFLLHYLPAGSSQLADFLFDGPGLGHLLAYVAVTFLGCLGYGSVFLLMGLVFRNPIIPTIVVLGWESINFLLPPALKKISVIYYLESLCPVAVPQRGITILADPAPLWLAVPGLLLLTAVVLFLAGLRLRRLEVSYSTE